MEHLVLVCAGGAWPAAGGTFVVVTVALLPVLGTPVRDGAALGVAHTHLGARVAGSAAWRSPERVATALLPRLDVPGALFNRLGHGTCSTVESTMRTLTEVFAARVRESLSCGPYYYSAVTDVDFTVFLFFSRFLISFVLDFPESSLSSDCNNCLWCS